MKTVRCAIYTRKSSEEGLSQDFNSLDAQHEACSAYILSQASEGWTQVAARYDDGGLSGGTLERPALQRLLADVAQGRIDIIVVYKVDRLTRSLLDFARLVEALDKSGTSFVSITQSFNTTTSMGRLTLNMLLSFAQFEREVTAERIRDKIAASKARGMWMGGIPPLGYKPDGRSLAIVEDHAAIVRLIFERYLAIGNVRMLATQLEAEGVLSPRRTTTTGRTIGGGAFSRGQLYLMLKCRTYLGEVQHKDQIYPGLHVGIVDRGLWDAVQARLADNVQGRRRSAEGATASLLAGKIVDEAGEKLIAAHAVKPGRGGGQRRYRYYVSNALHHEAGGEGMRVPAREIEMLVARQLAGLFDDMLALIDRAALCVDPQRLPDLEQTCAQIAARLRGRDAGLFQALLLQIEVRRDGIVVHCDTSQIAALLDISDHATGCITLTSDARLRRSGRAMRLVQTNGLHCAATPNPALVKLVTQAHRWWAQLGKGEVNITTLCEQEKVSDAWMSRVLRLAFLSPKVTRAILTGVQPASIDTAALLATRAVPATWRDQERALLEPKT